MLVPCPDITAGLVKTETDDPLLGIEDGDGFYLLTGGVPVSDCSVIAAGIDPALVIDNSRHAGIMTDQFVQVPCGVDIVDGSVIHAESLLVGMQVMVVGHDASFEGKVLTGDFRDVLAEQIHIAGLVEKDDLVVLLSCHGSLERQRERLDRTQGRGIDDVYALFRRNHQFMAIRIDSERTVSPLDGYDVDLSVLLADNQMTGMTDGIERPFIIDIDVPDVVVLVAEDGLGLEVVPRLGVFQDLSVFADGHETV